MITRLSSLLLPFIATLSLASAESISLTITVEGASPDTGQFFVSLFDSKEAYLKNPVYETVAEVDQEGSGTVTFKNLEPGEFAVSVVYDENGNGELDTGFMGIPKELVGFSRNAKGRFGPPAYEKVMFRIRKDSDITIQVGKAKS